MLARIGLSLFSLALLFGPSECQIALRGSSFSIRSTIIRRSGHEPASRFFVEESYSNEQRRARLDYRIKLTDEDETAEAMRLPKGAATRFSGSFVYDAGRDLAILTENHECTSSSVAEIESTLGLYMPKEADLADDHIVGPARLLFFVDKHRNKLALKSLKATLGVRNIQCLMYTYVHRDETGRDVTFTIYYSELSRAYDGESSLPIQIEIDFDQTRLLVDFWQPELLGPGSPKLLANQQGGFSSDFSVDMFAFKLLAGCPEALEDKLDSIFGRHEPRKAGGAGAAAASSLMRQFSFQARLNSYRVVDLRDTSQELFVAYDKALNSVRVDSLTANSMSVFNLAFNRAYYIKDYHRRGADELQQQQQQPAYDDAISSSNSECIVSQVFRGQFRHQEEKFTLEKLLLGSEKFLYMGKGQVRGVSAIVYEARNAILPFWVDHDFPYRSGNDICMRDALRGIPKLLDAVASAGAAGERRTLDLVAFFGEDDDEHRLLMLEIQEIDAARTKMFGKMSIFVDDFVWRLDNQAAAAGDDLRASELFSLADWCSAGAGQNRYAQVGMLLESSEQQQPAQIAGSPTDSLLDIVSVRETALLASFQDQFTMPASMIYELESRLTRTPIAPSGPAAGASAGRHQMQLSFRVAKHTEQLVDIEFKGLTSREHLNIPKQVQVGSFHECFMVAASEQQLAHFGYQNWNRICVLDSGLLETLLESASGVSPPKDGPAGQWRDSIDTLELYRLIRRRSWEATNIYNENLVPIKELKTVSLYGVDMAREKISFVVKALRVESAERQLPPMGANSSGGSEVELQLVRLGLIDGVGILRDPTSRRVVVGSDDSAAMNEERCHAACLASTDCRAYSTCVANLEVSCVLTGLQLDAKAHLLGALVSLLDQKEVAARKFVDKLTLELPDHNSSKQQQLELTKHPNCRIRLKNYLELFAKSGNKLQIIDGRRLYAVTDLGECAQRALMRNIRVLQSGGGGGGGGGDLSDASHLALSSSSSDVDERREAHRRALKSLALGFFYIDKQVYESSMQAVKDFIARQMRLLDGVASLDSINGFCLMNSGLPSEEEQAELKSLQPTDGGAGEKSAAAAAPPLNVYISHEYYKFKFELFYERHHGIRLGADSLSAAEQQAFAKLSRRAAAAAAASQEDTADEISESELRLVRSFLQAGKNQQIVRSVDAQSCAEFCFGQERGPWPACQSFDVVQSRSESGTGVLTSCFLNSITLKQAYESERYELIHDQPERSSNTSSGRRYEIATHYEPRAGFDSSSNLQLADTRAELEFVANLLQSSRSIRFHALGITFIVLISMIMGLTVGLVGGTKLFHHWAARRQQSNESNPVLAKESRVIEFTNEVDAEGSIKVH